MNRISSAWSKLEERLELSTIDIDHLIGNLSPRAQKVLGLARQQARRLGHPLIGTEHLLLGLIQLGQGGAFNALKEAGVDFATLHDAVIEAAGAGDTTKAMNMILPTPRLLKMFQKAKEEALLLRHNYIGTEALLLGLLRETDGVAAKVLTRFHVELESIRCEIIKEVI